MESTISHKLHGSVPERAHSKRFHRALPEVMYVGNEGCSHSVAYLTPELTAITASCGLCFLREGYLNELPGSIHKAKMLAENGNPQQTPLFLSHVLVSEGFKSPKTGQNLNQFRLARKQYSRKSAEIFPFASSLWVLMGYQPPLAKPLIQAVLGKNEPEIALLLDVSVYNVVDRLRKGINFTVNWINQYANI
jgi:hypothetical protein